MTQDSVIGPNDKISSLDDSTFTIDLYGKGVHCVPPNTMLMMNSGLDTLDAACNVVTGIR